VENVPFEAPEAYRYAFLDRDEELGAVILSVEDADGSLLLTTRTFDDEGNEDRAEVVVDPATLKPRTSLRNIVDPDTRVVADSRYVREDGDDIVYIEQRTYRPATAEEPDSQRSNPLRLREHFYDNDSSLFIWRTIPFVEGHEVTYTTVIANRRNMQDVTLRVVGQERVQTRAGEFDAWYVEIEAGGKTQHAWFATTDDHRLLVYNNEGRVFIYEGEA
jgi:hypothetical protein